MNIAYFGSPILSAQLLERLLNHREIKNCIKLIITQPDRPVGKRLEIRPTAVKKIARAYNIPVIDNTLSESQEELLRALDRYNIDLCIVFAYGELISPLVLTHPALGFWNIHPSLLPLYRGPTPISYPIMLGDKSTGTSLIRLIQKMDAGPIIAQEKVQLKLQDSKKLLEEKLVRLSERILIKQIQYLIKNVKTELEPQDEKRATYTHLLKKAHGYIALKILSKSLRSEPITIDEFPILLKDYVKDFGKPDHLDNKESGKIIFNYFKALTPWPGIWTKVQTSQGKKRLQITNMTYSVNQLKFTHVKLEGKNEVDFKTFNKAYRIFM